MKVLFLAREDCANMGYRYTDAVNRIEGWEAKSVSYIDNYIQYPKDIFNPPKQELEKLIAWADIVHAFDGWMLWRKQLEGKPLVVTYNGTGYRSNPGVYDNADKERGIEFRLCTTIDMTLHGLLWVPTPIPGPYPLPWSEEVLKNDIWTVSHAPTNRKGKSTEEVIQVVSVLDGIELDLIEKVPNAECIQRKAKSHIYVDQFLAGYGVNALEAWALGLPVIADTGWGKHIYELIRDTIGWVPFYQSSVETLANALVYLQSDREECDEWAQRGLAYMNMYHRPIDVGKNLVRIYKDVL